jgi:hypothetical protein
VLWWIGGDFKSVSGFPQRKLGLRWSAGRGDRQRIDRLAHVFKIASQRIRRLSSCECGDDLALTATMASQNVNRKYLAQKDRTACCGPTVGLPCRPPPTGNGNGNGNAWYTSDGFTPAPSSRRCATVFIGGK